jgi:4-hydroxybenzoate polyprenyltransferase
MLFWPFRSRLAQAPCFCSIPWWKAVELFLGYLAATSGYSFYFKEIPILDVPFLSGFSVFGIVAGELLAQVNLSAWLIAFAMFLFLGLAAVERYVELTDLSKGKRSYAARGYLHKDFPIIDAFGVNCASLAVLVLGLHFNSGAFQVLYSRAWICCLFCSLLLYSLMRVWLLTGRRQLRDDPVVFAIKDPASWLVAALAVVFFPIAASRRSQ